MSANASKVTNLDTPAIDKAAAAAAAEAPAVRAKTSGSASGDVDPKAGKQIINIFASEAEGGNFAVLVGVNGVVYQIPRGINVEVPDAVVSVLNDAVTDVTIPLEAGGTVSRKVPRYNFRVVG